MVYVSMLATSAWLHSTYVGPTSLDVHHLYAICAHIQMLSVLDRAGCDLLTVLDSAQLFLPVLSVSVTSM